jgi:hypothetical protein
VRLASSAVTFWPERERRSRPHDFCRASAKASPCFVCMCLGSRSETDVSPVVPTCQQTVLSLQIPTFARWSKGSSCFYSGILPFSVFHSNFTRTRKRGKNRRVFRVKQEVPSEYILCYERFRCSCASIFKQYLKKFMKK